MEWHKLWILQFAAWTATVLQPCLASFSWYVFPKEDFSHYLRWFCQMLPRDSFFLSHCICVACTNIGDSYSAKSKNTDYRQRLWICKSVYFMFQKWVLGELVSSGSCRCYLASECSGSWLERSCTFVPALVSVSPFRYQMYLHPWTWVSIRVRSGPGLSAWVHSARSFLQEFVTSHTWWPGIPPS